MGAESPTTTIVAWTKKTPLSVGDDKVVSKVASSSSSSSSSLSIVNVMSHPGSKNVRAVSAPGFLVSAAACSKALW